jgi:hypothetical protein
MSKEPEESTGARALGSAVAERALLARAQALVDRACAERVVAARQMLSTAQLLLHQHTDELLDNVRVALARFDGLPTDANLLSITGRDHDELAHSAVLAWLLTPGGNHGLGDAMLRHLLARSAAGAKLGLQDAPLIAHVTTELALDARRADIVGILQGTVFFIEVKVDAFEHDDQTRYYRECLEDPARRRAALTRFGRAATLAGPSPQVLGFFLRRRGRPTCEDPRATNLDWLDVEEDLARAEARAEPNADARAAIRAFRSTLLETSGATTPPMADIVRLRRLVDMPAASRADPLRTVLRLRSFLTAHEEEDADGK